jgi:tripartite-type tricarboxylate transporter receptor subunit TctC
VARRLADYMRSRTGATVIVDNKVGADGNLAAQFVLRAPADGHTVFLTGNSVHGANANLYQELPFDPINDFDMVGGVMTIPMVLAVRPDFPAANVQEFVAESKKRRKPLFYATGNNSTRGASELFKARYGLAADHVPYRGSPQVLADLIGGHFDFAFIDVNTVSPALKGGRVKGLAITSEKRLPALPEIPTVAESLPGFQFGAWVGVVVRAKTPPDVVAKLSSLVHSFSTDPATTSYLESIGSAPMPMNPKELRSFVESETKTWAEIVKAANIEKK